jgi:hypothetical protein
LKICDSIIYFLKIKKTYIKIPEEASQPAHAAGRPIVLKKARGPIDPLLSSDPCIHHLEQPMRPPEPGWVVVLLLPVLGGQPAGTGAAPYADVSFFGRLSRPVSAFNLSVFLRSEIYGRPGGPA